MEHFDWNVAATVLLVIITWLIYKANQRLTWFTGALESHSMLMLRIEAARGIEGKPPLKVIWWDPSLGAPPVEREHEQPVKLETIYCYMPESLRRFPPSPMDRFIDAFFGGTPL